MIRVCGRSFCSVSRKPIFNYSDLQDVLYYPEKWKDSIFDEDTNVLGRNVFALNHPYPKANIHVMVLPTCSLPFWNGINDTHIHLLYEMKERGLQVITKLSKENNISNNEFKMGMFAFPGHLKNIALHIISNEYNPEYCNTLRLWNMYNSKYFVDISDVIEMLETSGKVDYDEDEYKDLLKKPIQCDICSLEFKTPKTYHNHLSNCS